ncbi:hypothetical protein I4F81_010664 [Pyropia yezoensis]|uniref:Uncharacterized protein n=1 Tax=Pyropia yezoensis TaxID=2788 RepID=A0ACC3CD73_PYRYE|nr:hypothetical protein I4F81_010664 [Neopyropia yezoensis]|eukprot:contig_751_g60
MAALMPVATIVIIHPWKFPFGGLVIDGTTDVSDRAPNNMTYPVYVNHARAHGQRIMYVIIPPLGFMVTLAGPPFAYGCVTRFDVSATAHLGMRNHNVQGWIIRVGARYRPVSGMAPSGEAYDPTVESTTSKVFTYYANDWVLGMSRVVLQLASKVEQLVAAQPAD